MKSESVMILPEEVHLHNTTDVLARISIAVIKHHDAINVGRKGFIWAHITHSPLLKESRAGPWRQELMQMLGGTVAYWFSSSGLISMLCSGAPARGLGKLGSLH